ncbi:MAG: TIGR03936 family radical SAM-associated protein, partial [Candidatus Aminicenantes bacterium]|nr:TIGR03936 family radical SAM-associated protein [Candidatus Aminicenantes bacterium]
EKKVLSSVQRRSLGKETEKSFRYRASYSKLGRAQYLSHNDLSSILQRGFRKAGIEIQYSEGFHPKMSLSFLPALPLGMGGKEEILEFRSHYEFSEKAFLLRMNTVLPMDIKFLDLIEVDPIRSSMTDEIYGMVYSITLDGTQIDRLVQNWIGINGISKPGWSETLIKKLMTCAEEFKPGIVEKIEFFEKQNIFYLSVRFDKGHSLRIQDIVENIFKIENSVFNIIREKVIFKKASPIP